MVKKASKNVVISKNAKSIIPKPTSIKLSEVQKARIWVRFNTLQDFINASYKKEFSRRKTT
jgi:hypothetical protein